jgi:hypothetical protein
LPGGWLCPFISERKKLGTPLRSAPDKDGVRIWEYGIDMGACYKVFPSRWGHRRSATVSVRAGVNKKEIVANDKIDFIENL